MNSATGVQTAVPNLSHHSDESIKASVSARLSSARNPPAKAVRPPSSSVRGHSRPLRPCALASHLTAMTMPMSASVAIGHSPGYGRPPRRAALTIAAHDSTNVTAMAAQTAA